MSFRLLQTLYFPMFVSLKSHAIKHYLCSFGLPKLQLTHKFMKLDVVVLLFYVHGKHLRSCRDGQLT